MKTKELAILTLTVLFLTIPVSGTQQVLHVELEYDHGNVSISNADLAEGYPSNIVENSGDYTLRLINQNGDAVKSRNFDFRLDINPGGKLNQTSKTLTFAYEGETEKILAYENFTKIDEFQLTTTKNSSQKNEVDETLEIPWSKLGLAAIILMLLFVAYLSIVPDKKAQKR